MSGSNGNGHDARGGYDLITGGAGFVGTNVASRLLAEGRRVLLYDSLARPGVRHNVAWLVRTFGERVRLVQADVRDEAQLQKAVSGADRIFHFAAQVAVTTSLDNPADDFEVNARGTLNLLEAVRARTHRPSLLFTSTNKVYGHLGDLAMDVRGDRHEPREAAIRHHGIGEDHPLDFHSPYGCSKGAADQYVLDYARVFDLPAAVFRMSCIYGPQQRGTEDQGWIAWFLIRAMAGAPITIFGDGRQVRDALYVDDLVEAMVRCHARMDSVRGLAFNIGGGPGHTLSLRELLGHIERLGHSPRVRYAPWRPADQLYYASDIRRFREITGWEPTVGLEDGIQRLHRWLSVNLGSARPSPSVEALGGVAAR